MRIKVLMNRTVKNRKKNSICSMILDEDHNIIPDRVGDNR
jgi:hypothetical protein